MQKKLSTSLNINAVGIFYAPMFGSDVAELKYVRLIWPLWVNLIIVVTRRLLEIMVVNMEVAGTLENHNNTCLT